MSMIRPSSACFAVAAVLAAGTARSAEPPATSADALPEVVVTAQRREATLIEVPLSVSVIGGEDIESRGVEDLQQLAFATPNVAVFENNNLSGRSGVTIRGVPGRAGIYVDDVFVGDAAGYNDLLVDVQRVEILRGPQGTLFGRNSISGVINTITRRPQREFGGVIFARGGDFGQLSGGLALNGPIGATVAGKISAGYRKSDGWDTARAIGKVNGNDGYAVQGQLLFQPTGSLDVLVGVDFGRDDQRTGYSDAFADYNINTTGNLLGDVFRTSRIDGDAFDRVLPGRSAENRAERDNKGAFVRLDWSTGSGTLTSISAVRRIDFEFSRDGDGTTFDILSGRQPVEYRSFSQELRFASAQRGAFSWQGGVYYFKDERTSSDLNRLGADFPLAIVPPLAPLAPALVPGGQAGAVTLGRLAASPTLRAILGPVGTAGAGAVNTTQTTYDRNEIESVAGFASVSWKFKAGWELQVGGRYTHESIDAAYGRDVDPGLRPFVPVVARTTLSSGGDNDFSPSISLSFKPGDDVLLYATASKGFRSGGFNLAPGPATAAQRQFKPEKVRNYELGVKSFLADRRVMLNAAAFKMDYQDFQRSFYRVDPVTGPQVNTFNAEASVKGVEVEVSARLFESLTVGAVYGVQESKYDRYPGALVASYLVPNPPGAPLTVDLSGQPLPFTPKNSGALTIDWSSSIARDMRLGLGAEVQYRSEYNIADGVDAIRVVDSTTLVNAQASLKFGDGWTVAARGYNLTDERFLTGLDYNNFVGAVFLSLNQPRTFTLELRKDF